MYNFQPPPSSESNEDYDHDPQPTSNESKSKPKFAFEEGEVKFMDDNNPYVADPNFLFKWDPIHRINWKSLSRINFATLKQGQDTEVLHQNIEDLAYSDLKQEDDYVWISKEGHQAMLVLQLGLQYLLHTHRKVQEKTSVIQSYLAQQQSHLSKLDAMHHEQRSKMARYKKFRQKLNEQAIHFELMMNRMSPELLKDRVSLLNNKEEVFGADEYSTFARILRDKGLIQDQKENTNHNTPREPADNKQMDMMMTIMDSLKQIQSQIDHIKTNQTTTIVKEVHIQKPESIHQQPEFKGITRFEEIQEIEDDYVPPKPLVTPVFEERLSTPIRDPVPEYPPKVTTPIMDPVSIPERPKAKVQEVDDYQEDFEQSAEFSRGSSLKEDDKVLTLEDISQSSTQRKKWDKPAQQQQEQEIEQIISQRSPTEDKQSPKFQDENFKSPGRRPESSLRKQQTPIKEEEAEESEIEELKPVDESKNYEDDSFVNEDYLKSSGLVGDSTISLHQHQKSAEDAKRFNNPISTIEENKDEAQSIPSEVQPEEDDYKDDDFEQESQKSGGNIHNTLSQSGLPPLAGGKVGKSQQLLINVEENPRRNLLPQDFNLNIADSQMSIDFDISDSKVLQSSQGNFGTQQTYHQPQKRSTPIENLMKKKIDELEESGDYIDSNDFQVSESNFSQSFRSREAASAARTNSRQSNQQPKKQFYFYEQQKFSSYNKVSSNNSANGDDDDDF